MITVPAGQIVIEEGEEGAEAYIVARGELEVSRGADDEDGALVVLARLAAARSSGRWRCFRAPRARRASSTTRASILLVAKRDALEAAAQRRPEVGIELAAHCRRRMVANLARTSPVLVSVPPQERAMLVERFETRIYEKGDKLVSQGRSRRACTSSRPARWRWWRTTGERRW